MKSSKMKNSKMKNSNLRALMMSAAAVTAGSFLTFACAQEKESASEKSAPSVLSGLKLRNIGPGFPSGRISDFAVMPGGSHDYFVATSSGGLWRTRDNGISWKPLFDGQASYALSDVEVAKSNPDIIWVGSGENNAQRSVAYGDGVYKSTDGGASWKNMGLKDSGHIGQIWINPDNADHVLVAAQGPLWNEGGDRGLYKTIDGGETWERILEIDEHTGINEIVVHPDNVDNIVVSSYQRRRHVWTLINGGPSSGIHRTIDGGKSWTRIKNGLPGDHMGRIGLAGAPSAPNMIYAIIEANDEEKGVYRSTNFGQSWEKRSNHLTTSPQYYNEIIVDPKNPERLYSMDTFTARSDDGGKSFSRLSATHRHVDDHALWINPQNTSHIMIGGDGGIYDSYDGGLKWRHIDNLPLTQFYRATPDNDVPFYNVCGGTQDNNSLCAPSRTNVVHGVTNSDWKIILGGDGYKPQSDPEDPNIIYTQYQYGGLARYDRRTQERLYITPKPPSGENDYKWNWNTPLLVSPHNSKTIFYAAEKVFKSDDRGDSWKIISPDLTRQIDRNSLEVMGRVWGVDSIAKNDSTSIYGSIIGLSQSSLNADLIFAGSDDGVISVTQDGGENWRSVRDFSNVPEMSLVEDLITSVHDENIAFAVFDNHKRGDYKPYVYKTTDKGATWRSITGDLPERGSAHTIIQDHEDPDLLFVGTEFGLFFTQNGGKNWHQMKGNFPTIAVRDLEIQRRENDLIVATFGRGIYILDDYTPLRVDGERLTENDVTLFPIKDAWLYIEGDYWGSRAKGNNGDNFYHGDNPPYGAVFTYHLKDGFKSKAKARRGDEIKLEKDNKDTPYPDWDELRVEDRENAPFVFASISNDKGQVVRRMRVKASKGLHRVAWDMRLDEPGPTRLNVAAAPAFGRGPVGPLALPGTYTIALYSDVDGEVSEISEAQSFTLKPLGLSPEATDNREELQDFQLRTSALIRAVDGATRASNEMNDRIEHLKVALGRTPQTDGKHRQQLRAFEDRLDTIRIGLVGDGTIASRNEPAPVSINARLGTIRFSSWNSQSDVAQVHVDMYDIAAQEFEITLSALRSLEGDLRIFENELDKAGAPWTPGRLPNWSK